jgi:hypothetical protein
MTFYPFIEKTNKYLKTVRIIKNYVSFDMVFPESWVIIKKLPENVEILQTETPEGQTLTSFVCQNNKDFINILEKTLDLVIKTNIEREEKERLFKMKVKELQNIFEKEKLDSLKSLKFDLEEFRNIVEDEKEVNERSK